MSLGLFNCRLIQPTGDQLFFLSAVLPHRCQFGQALFSLLVARPARPRPAGGRRMLLAFPSQKDFAWFSAGAKSRRRQKSSLPPIHPRIFPKIHLTLPIDSAIEPFFGPPSCGCEKRGGNEGASRGHISDGTRLIARIWRIGCNRAGAADHRSLLINRATDLRNPRYLGRRGNQLGFLLIGHPDRSSPKPVRNILADKTDR